MKVVPKDGGVEKNVLIAMVVSEEVLARVASKWEKGMFPSEWSNRIAEWCVEYYNRYRKAPGKNVQSLYEAWADKEQDADTVAAVERLLSSLSGRYTSIAKNINPDLLIDQAGELFNRVRLQRHKDALEADLEVGDVKRALSRFTDFRQVEMGGDEWIDPLADEAAVQKAFDDKRDPLIVYPGALGEFFGDAFERDAFIAIQAPEKSAKSFWLLDIAFTAMRQNRHVAFFEAGDLSRSQFLRRLGARAARRPVKACTVKIPFELDGDGDVRHKDKTWDTPLSWADVMKANEKLAAASDGSLRLSVHPNSSLSVAGIRALLARWALDDWSPTVVVIDYCDILAPPSGIAETRDQINATWKALRRLSQELHCCVVTATQADADSYGKGVQSKKNFSEDKRKYSHVTGTFGINQVSTEKTQGLQRLNWLVLREGEFVESRCVLVAGALGISCPAVKSCWPRQREES